MPPSSILVVDDSRLQRRLLTANLHAWGYEVLEAESGLDALEICKAAHVDIVISDWMMPRMDGLEFCQAFRALNQSAYGYFILLTSKDSKSEVAEGLGVGADDFLTKPVNSGELQARLHAGERVLGMHKELLEKNHSVTQALAELQALYTSIDRDLLEAKKLQQSLLPETHLQLQRAEVSLILQSSGHIGGDMVGVYHNSPERLGIYAFDVSGHGVSSALMTTRLAGCLGAGNPAYSIAMQHQADGTYALRKPDEIAMALNRRMIDEFDTDLYLTILLAEFDLNSGVVSMVQAGHPSPMLIRKDKPPEFIGTGGLPIGLFPAAEYQIFKTHLASSDRLLIYSDGFTEAENPVGDFLGDARFVQMVSALSESVGPEMLADLVWEAQNFSGKAETSDDLSAVLFQLNAVNQIA
jgi:sigma-B regulation protein RsbU (phosphoserine phosphatase)